MKRIMISLSFMLLLAILPGMISAAGCCFDPLDGRCSRNADEGACASPAVFYASPACSVNDCAQGCCVLESSGAMTTRRECEILSANAGLENAEWSRGASEEECASVASQREYGACVSGDYPPYACVWKTGQQCQSGRFYPGVSCTASELNTSCNKTENTICWPEQSGSVYTKDTCGNPDEKKEACDYSQGTICKTQTGKSAICKSLNCENGRKNGESWCIDGGGDKVGGRFYRRYCLESEIFTEPCADFKNELCKEDEGGTAACVKNDYEICYDVAISDDSSNPEECPAQSCIYTADDLDSKLKKELFEKKTPDGESLGICMPAIPPGYNFWSSQTGKTSSYCSYGNFNAEVKFENKEKESSAGARGFWYLVLDDKDTYGWAGLFDSDSEHWTHKTRAHEGTLTYEAQGGTDEINPSGDIIKTWTDKLFFYGDTWTGNTGYRILQPGVRLETEVSTNPLAKIFRGLDGDSRETVYIPLDPDIMPFLSSRCANMLGDCEGHPNWIGEDGGGIAVGDPEEAYVKRSGEKYTKIRFPTSFTDKVGEQELLNAEVVVKDINGVERIFRPYGTGFDVDVGTKWHVGLNQGVWINAPGALPVPPDQQAWAEPYGDNSLTQFNDPIQMTIRDQRTQEVIATATIYKGSGKMEINYTDGTTSTVTGCNRDDPSCIPCKKSGDEIICEIDFTCSSWRAPEGGDKETCGKCGADGLQCSEYRCRALGRNCELKTPEDSDKSYCVSTDDNTPPKITSKDYDAINPVITWSKGEAIPPWTSVQFTITTDEDAHCRFNMESSAADYSSMKYDFGEGFGTTHTLVLNIPGKTKRDLDGVKQYNLIKDGLNQMFIRCEDVSGNTPDAAELIKFEVMQTPEYVPAALSNFTPASGGRVEFNMTEKQISFRLNEPATCKWDFEDKDYRLMNYSFSCDSDVSDSAIIRGWFCRGTLTNITTNLDEETKYYIRCKDNPSFEGSEDSLYKRNENVPGKPYTLRPSEQLLITELSPSGEVVTGQANMNISLVAVTSGGAFNGQAACRWKAGDSENLSSVPFVNFSQTGSNIHRQTLANRTEGTYYSFAACRDSAGNTANASSSFTLIIDSHEPIITRINDKSKTNLQIKTDENAKCYASFNKTLGCYFNTANSTLLSGFEKIHLTPWKEDKVYYIRCMDFFDNEACVVEARTY